MNKKHKKCSWCNRKAEYRSNGIDNDFIEIALVILEDEKPRKYACDEHVDDLVKWLGWKRK